jgi:hypothetical protein
MEVFTSQTDIGLYDPKIPGYKFAVAFHDNHMVSPISGIFELKFYSVWGDSVIPIKCGRIKIDFGLESHVPPSVSEGKLLPNISFINPSQSTSASALSHYIYALVTALALLPFLKTSLVKSFPLKRGPRFNALILSIPLVTLLFLLLLFAAHYLDMIFEVIPLLGLLLCLQVYTYNKIVKKTLVTNK